MARDNETRAAEYEQLAAEASARASNVTTPNQREHDALVNDYNSRARNYAAAARSLRKPA